MAAPLLSIIVPCYNLGNTLGRTLDSLQPYAEHALCEVILVDDRSTDATGEQLQAWQQGRAVRYLCNEVNLGLHGSRKQGFAQARGKYVWFVDGGDAVVYHAGLFGELQDSRAEIIRFEHRINRQGMLSGSSLKSVVWGQLWLAAFLREHPVFEFDYRMAWEDEIVAARARAFLKKQQRISGVYYIYYMDDESNALSLQQYQAADAEILDHLLDAAKLSRKSASKAIKMIYRFMLSERGIRITGSLSPRQKKALARLSLGYLLHPVKVGRLLLH